MVSYGLSGSRGAHHAYHMVLYLIVWCFGGYQDADECIRLEPTFVKGYTRKAHLEFVMKDFDAALVTYGSGLKVDPDNQELRDGEMRTIRALNDVRRQALHPLAVPQPPCMLALMAIHLSRLFTVMSSLLSNVYSLVYTAIYDFVTAVHISVCTAVYISSTLLSTVSAYTDSTVLSTLLSTHMSSMLFKLFWPDI